MAGGWGPPGKLGQAECGEGQEGIREGGGVASEQGGRVRGGREVTSR